MENPKIAIFSFGNATACFLDGKGIGSDIGNLEYSARDDRGELRPTLKVLDVDVGKGGFSWNEDHNSSGFASLRDFIVERLNLTVEDIEAANAAKKLREAKWKARTAEWEADKAAKKAAATQEVRA